MVSKEEIDEFEHAQEVIKRVQEIAVHLNNTNFANRTDELVNEYIEFGKLTLKWIFS